MAGHVALVGEILVDMLGEGGASLEEAALFRPAPGGAPANAAVAAAMAGATAFFAGRVGQDAFGRLLSGTLRGAGVDTRFLLTDPGRFTTLAFVLPAARGAHGFQFMRGADAALSAADLAPELFTGLSALGCGGVSLSAPESRAATLAALRAARTAGALSVFDVNWRPLLWSSPDEALAAFREAAALADVVKCNEVELELLCGAGDPVDAARRLLGGAAGPRAVVVTLGERGALWVDRGAATSHPGFAVEAVDAIGAGDCFTGTLLAWCAREAAAGRDALVGLTGGNAARLLERCNAASALSTLRPGAMAAMPPAAAVDAFLAANPVR